ncbi:MAG: asparagine synthetase B [Candidatus Latescibacteria bacterium]|nr:asparagine synthetase B [Candidatus Latescibacterota bacterium]
MSAISCIINWDGRPVDARILKGANSCVQHRCPDGAWVWVDGAVGMAQADLSTLPEDEPGVKIVAGPLHIAASCRLDNRSEVVAALPPGVRPVSQSDTALVLAAFQAWGEDCADRLIGDFAFAIWNEHTRSLFAARDISGARQLYYHDDGSTFFLASDRTQIFQDLNIPFEVNEEHLIEYLTPIHQSITGWDKGFFKNVHAVPAGSKLVAKNGKIDVTPYWTWQESAPDQRSPGEVLEEYAHRLDEAVRHRLRSRGPVAMELSGGLDSSAVACLAARMSGPQSNPIHTFSIAFDSVIESDERPYIQEVLNQHGDLKPHYLIADTLFGPRCMYPDWKPESIMGPFDFWVPLANHKLYNMVAESGCRVSLNGKNGNELNSGGYFVYYDLLRRKQFGEILKRFKIDRSRYGWYALRAFLAYGIFPMVTPFPIMNAVLKARERRSGTIWDVPEFMTNSVRQQIVEKDEELRVGWADRNRFRCPVVQSTIESIFPPKTGYTHQYAQPVEPRYPYFDRRLIEMVLGMPHQMKWDAEEPRIRMAVRRHHRQAMAGIIPEKLRVGYQGVEFTPVLRNSLPPAAARKWLQDSSTVHIFDRGYVNPEKFMVAVEDSEQLAGYISGFLSLEGWLRAVENGGSLRRLISDTSTSNTRIVESKSSGSGQQPLSLSA